MGTHGEDVQVPTLLPERQQEQAGLGFSSSEEAALIDKFQNVGFHSHYGGGVDNDGFSTAVLPLRPYAGDCPHYLKTGICKFGQHCKFNHPVKRTGPVVKEDGKDSEKAGQHVECKYYLTAGGCKYGKFCRYSHSKDGSDNAARLLNFLGLPMREGEKECPYYMRHGSCGYGAHCVFHHPEPSSNGEPNDKSLRQSGNILGSLDCESALLQLSEASQHHQASWSSYPLDSKLSYQDDNSHHNIAKSFPQEANVHPELSQYQAPELPYQMSRHAYLTPGANRVDMLQPIVSTKVEEFPERPGQPECAYFMKTGFCKFKSACRFHHPKGQLECLLSEKGLPLRPGRAVCRHYGRFGVCKFGRECLFDHPVNQNL